MPDPKINQAVTQMQQLYQKNRSQHAYDTSQSSANSDTAPPIILRTLNRRTRHLRRAIRVPARLTYQINFQPHGDSDSKYEHNSSSSSSDISPQARSRSESSAARSARRRHQILQTFQ